MANLTMVLRITKCQDACSKPMRTIIPRSWSLWNQLIFHLENPRRNRTLTYLTTTINIVTLLHFPCHERDEQQGEETAVKNQNRLADAFTTTRKSHLHEGDHASKWYSMHSHWAFQARGFDSTQPLYEHTDDHSFPFNCVQQFWQM